MSKHHDDFDFEPVRGLPQLLPKGERMLWQGAPRWQDLARSMLRCLGMSTAHRLAARIRSGHVSINCHGAVGSNIPFGGYGQSGWGREFGREGLDAYLKTKATTVIY